MPTVAKGGVMADLCAGVSIAAFCRNWLASPQATLPSDDVRRINGYHTGFVDAVLGE